MRSTTELRQHRHSGVPSKRCSTGPRGDAALWPGGGRNVKAGCGKPAQRVSGNPMGKEDEERKRRLAEALRQNLRRRKAQARGGPPEEAAQSAEPEPD